MKPPQLPEEPVPVLTDDQLRRLLKACEGKDFTARSVSDPFQVRNGRWRLGPKARRMELSYWSGIRSAKKSTSSEAAGGSRLPRLTTT